MKIKGVLNRKHFLCTLMLLTMLFILSCPCYAKSSRIYYYGHRGYTNAYPENTIIGLKAAIRAGFDGVEFDVQPTSDGSLMVFHDTTLTRVCGVDLPIESINVKNRSSYPVKFRKKTALIPTLQEAVTAMAKMKARMYIHLKRPGTYSDAQLTEIFNLLKNNRVLSKTVVFCENFKVLKKLQNMGITVGYLDLSTNSKDTMKSLKECIKNKVDSFIVFWPSCLNSNIVKKCIKNNITVGSYKVRYKKEVKRLKKLGVNFMFNYGCLMK